MRLSDLSSIKIFQIFSLILGLVYYSSGYTDAQTPTNNTDNTKKGDIDNLTFEYELDPYYTNIAFYVNTTDQAIKEAGETPEFEVYKDLFTSSLLPRFIVIEAAIYPLPIIGLLSKEYTPSIFNNAQVNNKLNLIKAVTAGFEEPYSIAAFFGNIIKFTESNGKKHRGNFGFMGFLFSVSNQHIKDNQLIPDNSLEVEWKIKGDRKRENHKLSWSFRIGMKIHGNPDIKDSNYISMRRSRIDYNGTNSSLFRNLGAEYTVHFDRETHAPIKHAFLFDKKIPLKNSKITASLGFGLNIENDRKYTGDLAGSAGHDNIQLVLRPNLHF